ncbi:MAG: DNA polymerase III subunit chi [Blastomonas sp.]
MRVDFYHLTRDPPEKVIPALAQRVLDSGARLTIADEDEARRRKIGEGLWQAGPETYLAHGDAGGEDADLQPILIGAEPDTANGATMALLADGRWRAQALSFDRAFYLFSADTIDGARAAWKALGEQQGVDRHYWKQQDGKWVEGP